MVEPNVKGFLLEIGNLVLQELNNDKSIQKLPNNSWHVGFSAEDAALKFKILLNYHILDESFVNPYLTDIFMYWIPKIAILTGSLLIDINPEVLSSVNIEFIANKSSDSDDNYNFYCSVLMLFFIIAKHRKNRTPIPESEIMTIMKPRN